MAQANMRDPNSDWMVTKPAPPPWFRWTVLVVISMAMFGNYYVYDAISPIADMLKSQLNFSDSNIGWLVFGLGAESLIVAVTCAIAKWFKGKELSFAFGVKLTIARLGSFAALNSPSSFSGYQLQLPLSLSSVHVYMAGSVELVIDVKSAPGPFRRELDLSGEQGR